MTNPEEYRVFEKNARLSEPDFAGIDRSAISSSRLINPAMRKKTPQEG